VAGPKLGPEARHKHFLSTSKRFKYLPATFENVSICRSSEVVEPCGSFFGLDPVEDSDRRRDVPHEVVIR
jgi:hypothetical protein